MQAVGINKRPPKRVRQGRPDSRFPAARGAHQTNDHVSQYDSRARAKRRCKSCRLVRRKRNRGERPILQRSVMSAATATAAALPRKIAIVISIPSMIMNDHTAIALPVAFEEHLSLVPGRHPTRAWIRRTRPVSVVPPVMLIDRIPVTLDPHVLRLRWRRRSDVHDLRRWWRTNLNPDRNRCLGP